MVKLLIIILNYNTPKDTLELLDSLKSATTEKKLAIETIVVDNHSSDDSIAKIGKKSKVKIIASSENFGFSGGNNLGLKSESVTGVDYVMLLNPDTLVPKSFYHDFYRTVRKSKYGIFSPLIYFAKGYEFHHYYQKSELGKVIWYGGGVMDWNNVLGSHAHVDEVDNGQLQEGLTDFATGACLVINKDTLSKVGFLNDSFYLYLEDLEYCLRARKLGIKVGFTPSFYLWHKVSTSTGGSGSSLNDYFITRNRLLIGFKYARFRTKLALLREGSGKLFTGTKAQKTAVIDFFCHRLGKGSWLK